MEILPIFLLAKEKRTSPSDRNVDTDLPARHYVVSPLFCISGIVSVACPSLFPRRFIWTSTRPCHTLHL